MKKLFAFAVIAVLFSFAAQAELELSANVTSIAAYQNDSADAANMTAGGITQGDFAWAATPSTHHFGFVVDQAELDVENEFGENIMARFDVDFWDVSAGTGVWLEQGYVTANIAIGNGMEFLMGLFNSPTGLESIDRWENVFSTYTPGFMYLRPWHVLGAKIYYEFNDVWNMDLAALNNMNDVVVDAGSDYPSGLFRLGAKWDESFVNLAVGYGPELADNSDADLFGNFWGQVALSDNWDLGFEVMYRATMVDGGGDSQAAGAAQLYAVCEVNDVWTVQGRLAAYDELVDATGDGASTTGGWWNASAEGLVYSGTFGATYTITDGAKMKLEYRFDYADSAAAGTDAASYHTAVAEFGYTF
jgi:hypothetical protein